MLERTYAAIQKAIDANSKVVTPDHVLEEEEALIPSIVTACFCGLVMSQDGVGCKGCKRLRERVASLLSFLVFLKVCQMCFCVFWVWFSDSIQHDATPHRVRRRVTNGNKKATQLTNRLVVP